MLSNPNLTPLKDYKSLKNSLYENLLSGDWNFDKKKPLLDSFFDEINLMDNPKIKLASPSKSP